MPASTPYNPGSSPGEPTEATAATRDGHTLRTLRWQSSGEPWAAALIVHGLGEHAGRYATVAGPLSVAGVVVHGYDLRGFGGSTGRRAFVDRWTRHHDDLEDRMAAVRVQHPGLPIVLYGHSMGGLIALGYVLANTPRPLPERLVLSAPGLADAIPAWKHVLSGVLTSIMPGLRLRSGLAVDGLSRDPSVRAAADADRLCQDTSTVRLGAEGFAEQRRVAGALARITALPVPTYVFHGSDDPIVPLAATSVLDGKGNVTRRIHAGLRHECHHEPEHGEVLGEVTTWLAATLAPGNAHPGNAHPGSAHPGSAHREADRTHRGEQPVAHGVESADNRRVASGERETR